MSQASRAPWCITATGLGLAALYFLIAAGLSLVFGLAGVLNFAHGLFLSVGAYATWWAAPRWGFGPAVVFGVACGAAVGALVEQNLAVVRRLAGAAVVLSAGRVAWSGPAAQLLGSADQTRSLLGVGTTGSPTTGSATTGSPTTRST